MFNLEKGYSIGLYRMQKEQQLSIESYIGYLVFKNGIPVAYGGGWIFGERCQFGINILAPFRGGESAYLFSQLLRVYYQHFEVKRFVVKPYQFGKNNNEALQNPVLSGFTINMVFVRTMTSCKYWPWMN